LVLHESQQLVAIGSGHDQHELDLTRAIELVARRLERRHRGLARLARERVLGFVDDQGHRCLGGVTQRAEGVRERDTIHAANATDVQRHCAGDRDAVEADGFG
jgi:hypothetical protein